MPPYMPPYKLFSTARSYLLGLIIFFTPQDIFYRYNFTHASPILFSTIKSTPTLIFLKFTFTQIQVVFLSFFLMQFHQIQHNFHSPQACICEQHKAITLSYILYYTFRVTFGDYCGIKLLLERQYGSHYLYLNLKKALESAKATIFTLRYLRDDEQNRRKQPADYCCCEIF